MVLSGFDSVMSFFLGARLKSFILSLWIVLYILFTSRKTRMSTAYKTRKNEEIKADIAETNIIPLETPSTKARKEVVIREIRNASINAIKRGLRDMILV